MNRQKPSNISIHLLYSINFLNTQILFLFGQLCIKKKTKKLENTAIKSILEMNYLPYLKISSQTSVELHLQSQGLTELWNEEGRTGPHYEENYNTGGARHSVMYLTTIYFSLLISVICMKSKT